MAAGDALWKGGSVAHGDLDGPDKAGGLATNDAFSVEPAFKIRPFPDARLLDLTDGEAVLDGTGDLDFSLASFVPGAAGVGSVA